MISIHTIQMGYDIYLNVSVRLSSQNRGQDVGLLLFIHFWGLTNKRDQITNVDPLKSNELNAVMRST